eukprot:TRINITY_DN1197_c0_g1_i1.p1 TRINITY_DN1197_c0_g1~~TRINITY_DN1197_c0_g1_i1.p1  ORF type:complete len:231 (-),score=53.06 TRINITY_DN1197_c0_g1_i1:64-756(-)
MSGGESHEVNVDFGVDVAMDPKEMEWTGSPSSTVSRKRFFLMGAKEAGVVTSLVRYDRDSAFPSHPHPQGEEIFVLEGLFCDCRGEHGPGMYLLNPEGFVHSPYSKEGCIVLVRLRQYAGPRPQIALSTNDLPFQPDPLRPGLSKKTLFSSDQFPDFTELHEWSAGSEYQLHTSNLCEIFVLEGEFQDSMRSYTQWTWVRYRPSSNPLLRTPQGCKVLLKETPLQQYLPQ